MIIAGKAWVWVYTLCWVNKSTIKTLKSNFLGSIIVGLSFLSKFMYQLQVKHDWKIKGVNVCSLLQLFFVEDDLCHLTMFEIVDTGLL